VYIYIACLIRDTIPSFIGLNLTENDDNRDLPELDALITFYEKICKTLPVDELLPELVTQRVITIDDKARIAAIGKTESDRTQYLLDHYIARPLSAKDPRFFNILLDLMSTSTRCSFLINDIHHYLSIAVKHQKFSGEFVQCSFVLISYIGCYGKVVIHVTLLITDTYITYMHSYS